ncbi:CLUMA_CG007521, isoform A [Clunio marinus]|uniref:Large ribosomal subunit protein uL10m n=1 Tax=Clunio marinus TaxID=568069 RepID=A0A1J1I1B4_9DIPT|nr:CLUMA_CG007521, isoform A [Clunio marinus]
MAQTLKRSFLTPHSPVLNFQRFRGKINIQRPRAPGRYRQLLEAVSNPIYPKRVEIKPCIEVRKIYRSTEENPYEKIIARETKNWFDHSQMVTIFHINPISSYEFFKARVAFFQEGMQIKKYGMKIMKLALNDTKYEAVLSLHNKKCQSTVYAFSPDHKKVATVLKIVKKIPQMHLLAGIVEDQFLSKNELIEYSQQGNIDIARSQFVNVLNMASSQLVQNLQSHQSNLVNILDAHVRESGKFEDSNKSDESEKSEKS